MGGRHGRNGLGFISRLRSISGDELAENTLFFIPREDDFVSFLAWFILISIQGLMSPHDPSQNLRLVHRICIC
jgi:hypothetical protein